MRHLAVILTALVAASGTVANAWFPGTKAVYKKWHETELERWLADHEIPYPSPANRADLEGLVEKNWNDFVVEPYKKWDTAQLSSFIHAKSKEASIEADETKDSLVAQVKANWYETDDNARQAWASVKDWIFDTWTESQLKAFCDKNNIPVLQPRHRDTFLQKARSGYEATAKKLGETTAYPGNWLYTVWSESDLKSWFDTHGIPAPQTLTRDKLVASVRRNSRLAYLKAQRDAARATASAQAAYSTLTDMIINAWSESQLKEFCEQNSIPVPQGTRVKELRALVRKHRAGILVNTVGASVSSAFSAATSRAGNQYAKVTDDASLAVQDAFNQAMGAWSESRLKAYLDSRGIPIPQHSNLDELRALVRKNSRKFLTVGSAWTFDDFSRETLKEYLAKYGDAVAKTISEKKDASRDELMSAALAAYSSVSTAGGAGYTSMTSAIATATGAAKTQTFDAWSDTDLKEYLDSYGIPIPQGSKLEELKALARKHSTYFRYGTSSPGETLLAKLEETAKGGWKWVANQLHLGNQAAQKKAAEAKAAARAKAKEPREEL